MTHFGGGAYLMNHSQLSTYLVDIYNLQKGNSKILKNIKILKIKMIADLVLSSFYVIIYFGGVTIFAAFDKWNIENFSDEQTMYLYLILG